jgi:hypothetical protein
MRTIFAFIFIFLSHLALWSQSVLIDETWANQGFLTLEIPGEDLRISDYFVSESGDVYAVGYTQEEGSSFKQSILIKINSDGSIDTDFGEDGMIRPELYYDEDHQFDDVLERDDGTILAVGNMQSGQGPAISAFFMSFNADGTTDTSYGDNGFLEEYGGMSSGTGYPDIYKGNSGDLFFIRSYFHSTNNFPEITFSRQGNNSFNYFLGDGYNGWYLPHEAYISQNDDFFLPLSYNGSNYGQGTAAIAKFNDSWIDGSFGDDGIYEYGESVPGDSYRHADEMNDGDIVVAGQTQIGDYDNLLITQLNGSGEPNENFGTGGHLIFGEDGYDYRARSVYYLESENMLIIRIIKFDDGIGTSGLLAVNPDGTIEESFGQEGFFWTGDILPGTLGRTHLMDDGSLLFSGLRINEDGNTASYFGKVNFDFEYQGFQSGLMALNSSEARYYNQGSQIIALEIDSVSFDGDSIFYPSPHWYNHSFWCYSPDSCSHLGKEVRISADGTHRFITGRNDTLTILLQAEINDSWIVYESEDGEEIVQGTVTDLAEEEVMGDFTDVKAIAFQMYNSEMEPVNAGVNFWEIKHSDEYGLVAFPDFSNFPEVNDLPTSPSPMKFLEGIKDGPGIQNIGALDIFNFQVGDEIHIEESIYSGDLVSIEQYAQRIVDRTDYTDSVSYEMEIKSWVYYGFTADLDPQPYDTVFVTRTYSIDTTYLDIAPGHPFFTDDNEGLGTYNWLDEGQFGIKKVFMSEAFMGINEEQNCYSELIDWGCFSDGYRNYLEGLGGPYYNCISSAKSSHNRVLKYFQKGDEEWGEPLNVENVKANYVPLKIYPNPASDQIRIDLDYSSQNLEIRILEITGKLIRESAYTGTVDVSSLPGGIYLIQVMEDSKVIARTKFVKQE